jgi:hypothetical protein
MNSQYFRPPLLDETWLRARGFDARGARSGGIAAPAQVMLPAGAIILRLYHDPNRRFGEWWFTPHEMHTVAEYFARSGAAFAEGRGEGAGILHAVLAVRGDWAGGSPAQLGRFFAVRLRDPLEALYGEADDAPDPTHAHVQKPQLIMAGAVQRRVRQMFLPNTRDYSGAFLILGQHDTDLALLGAIARYRRAALYFEH